MVQITKDNAYDAVAPDDFPAMLDPERYGAALDGVRQDHLRDPRPFLGSAGQEIHRLHRRRSTRRRRRSCRTTSSRSSTPASATTMTRGAEDQVRQRVDALAAFRHPAWRAGRARAVGFALPHPARPGRAGIRRQPDARGSASRHRASPNYIKARWGTPLPCGATLQNAADRDGRRAGGLQEDRRHADAGRRPRHGRLRDAVPERRRTRCW